jgi:MerR family transcriptional regulator, heat shock protein HspR
VTAAPPPPGLDDVHWPVYTVGQVAELLGVQPAYLRRLDTQQVVRPSRSEGGQRRYSRSEITRIQQAQSLAGEGFTMPAIRRVLELQAEVAELQQQLSAERASRAARRRAGGYRPGPSATGTQAAPLTSSSRAASSPPGSRHA